MKHFRGQVGLQETLLVVFVIVVILVLGMMVYFRFSLARVQTIGETLSEQESTILLARVGALAELQCRERDCLDTSKFLPFPVVVQQHRDFYTNFLGYKKIVVEQVYPAVEGKTFCTVEQYGQDAYPENCRSWVLYDQKPRTVRQEVIVRTFVSLYFPELGEYRIGRLEVVSYV